MSELSLRNLSDYYNDQFDLLDQFRNEPALASEHDSDPLNPNDTVGYGSQPISQKRGSLSRPATAPMGRSIPCRGSSGVDSDSSHQNRDARKKNKRGCSSLKSSCPPDLQYSDISTAEGYSFSSIDLDEDTDLLANEDENNKRQRGYSKEGSLVSRLLKKLLLPSLSSLRSNSDSKLSDSVSKLSGMDQEEKEEAPGSCDFPGDSQPSQHEKILLEKIEKMISCKSIASFPISDEGDVDSSDSDDNGIPQDDEVFPIDLSIPLTETDLRSLFKAFSSTASSFDNPTNDSSSDDLDGFFDKIFSSKDLTENCRNLFAEISKISSRENVSTTRPKLSRSITGLGPSVPGSSVYSPTENDILLGKGAKSNSHPGNIKFREIVESTKPLYREQGTSKKGKKAVTLQCLERIHDYGGRFLELVAVNPDTWVVISDDKARQKISQRIREKK